MAHWHPTFEVEFVPDGSGPEYNPFFLSSWKPVKKASFFNLGYDLSLDWSKRRLQLEELFEAGKIPAGEIIVCGFREYGFVSPSCHKPQEVHHKVDAGGTRDLGGGWISIEVVYPEVGDTDGEVVIRLIPWELLYVSQEVDKKLSEIHKRAVRIAEQVYLLLKEEEGLVRAEVQKILTRGQWGVFRTLPSGVFYLTKVPIPLEAVMRLRKGRDRG